MKVIKIELEGLTCSFRYPHFHIGNQPTYRMPPPSTIYGHICSAYGDWIDRASIRFGYFFSSMEVGRDYEHIYQLSVGSGKASKYWKYPKNIEGELVPLLRDFIFKPKLILYIDTSNSLESLYESFRSPKYPVILGRSQDLACYRKVEIISLETAKSGYFENTLLPWRYRLRTKLGNPILMPKFIEPEDRTKVTWAPYLLLENRLFLSDEPAPDDEKTANTMKLSDNDGQMWTDPATPEIKGGKRIIAWHNFIEEKYDFTSALKQNTG